MVLADTYFQAYFRGEMFFTNNRWVTRVAAVPTGTNLSLTRDNVWLRARLTYLWSAYFADIEKKNTVVIKFGRWAKCQFGVITYDRRTSISTITINKMFAYGHIPDVVVDHTIAHELVHYAHGFSSPHKRKHKYPHHGGVVNKDLVARGLGFALQEYKVWLRIYRKSL